MYCGDETGAFIGDIGSHSSRFGYGGEDHPKMVLPSYCARTTSSNHRYIPSSCYNLHHDLQPIYRMAQQSQQPIVDPIHYLQQGDMVQDWEAYETMWKTSIDALHVQSAEETIEHPILAVTPGMTHIMSPSSSSSSTSSSTHRNQLIKQTEIFMETFSAPCLFLAPSPMLAAFAHGRQTCIVADVGAAGTRVTPIIDGHVLHHSQQRSGRGGDWISQVAWQAMLMMEPTPTVQPRYQLRNKDTTMATPAFHSWAMQDLLHEFKTSCEHVKLAAYRTDEYTTPFLYPPQDSQNAQDDTKPTTATTTNTTTTHGPTYDLPDGTMIDLSTHIGKDLCRLPELFFTEDVPMVEEDITLLDQHPTLSNAPLHHLIHASLTAVGDVDARKELVGNVVLTGSASYQMESRLSYELNGILTGNYKPRILSSNKNAAVERSCSAWIGASILTSLGSFQQLWLSKKEYEEYGAALAIQRFPG